MAAIKSDDELDAIVELIKAPIKNLQMWEAEMLLATVYFRAAIMSRIVMGEHDEDIIRRHINESFTAYLSSNPIPPKEKGH